MKVFGLRDTAILVLVYFLMTVLWMAVIVKSPANENALPKDVVEKSSLFDDNIDIEFLKQFESPIR